MGKVKEHMQDNLLDSYEMEIRELEYEVNARDYSIVSLALTVSRLEDQLKHQTEVIKSQSIYIIGLRNQIELREEA